MKTTLCRCSVYALLFLAMCSVAFAQNSMKLMNDIKLSPDKFIYSQSIHVIADSALASATVNVWRESNIGETDTISIEELKPCLHNIVSTRDSLTRQFVYVSREDLKTIRLKHHPSADALTDGIPFPVPPIVTQIMDMPDLKAIYDFLKFESSAGRLSGFGALQKASDPAECQIVICDAKSLKPIAVLSAENNRGQRVSLLTGLPDSLENYHGTYGLWYKLNRINNHSEDMKRLIFTFCLVYAITAIAQQRVTFKFSEGLQNPTLKTQMEREISKLLTEINHAAKENRSLQLNGINMAEEARKALQNRWNHSSHFQCWDEENVQRCITDYSGYEVRDITVNMLNPNIKGNRTRELCICFSREGIITDVHPQLSEYSYQQVVDNSYNVEDRERQMEILKWVEQFRSYYDEKDIASLEKVFSDKALIITGRVINTKRHASDMASLKPEVVYSRLSKKEYLKKLGNTFRNNSFIKLSFSDIEIGRHRSKSNIFWVGLKQKWESQHYGDNGYLFLVWEFPEGGGSPLVHVRTWQPDQPNRRLADNEKFNINDFFFP